MRRAIVGGIIAAATVLVIMTPLVACEDASLPSLAFEAGSFQIDSGIGKPTVTPPSSNDAKAPDADLPDADLPDAEIDPDGGTPAKCDDGALDPGETCDPLSSCPTTCPAVGCQVRALENAGTCMAKCVDVTVTSACVNGDKCCPAGGVCNASTDDDCAATCGNGVLEGTETCDPLASCPAACPTIGCQQRTLQNAGTCTAACVNGATTTTCVNGDGCCPAGCNAVNDSDCGPGCGNNVVEPGETCDPLTSCPTTCAPIGCQNRALTNAGTCTAACVNTTTTTACINGDGCCAPGCNANNDNDCKSVCPNGVVEPGETCDGACPASCPPKACQLFKLDKPGTCQAQCVASGLQDVCINDDGCCPKGCNANNDNDCKAVCGNGVLESGETCDPVASCPRACSAAPYACVVNRGAPKTCDVACHQPETTCALAADKCCPYNETGGCGSDTDKDCPAKKWDFIKWPATIDYTKGQCTTVTVSGIVPGGWYDVTTCAPPGAQDSTGNPMLGPMIDAKTGAQIAPGDDDCPALLSPLPRLAGWDCNSKSGLPTMACATPSPGGFVAPAGTAAFQFTVCPATRDLASRGSATLYIWYNASKVPTGG